MKDEFGMLGKPWLLWEHDPCMEGGWCVSGFDTQEAAVQEAKRRHAEADVHFQHMVDFCKKNNDPDPWVRENECYDGCIVTPGLVFRLDVERAEKKQGLASS